MGDVINLRAARKARKRVADQRLAETNRVKHGRTKAEKHLSEATRRKLDTTVDSARREHPDQPQP